jgi:hypothetical protein
MEAMTMAGTILRADTPEARIADEHYRRRLRESLDVHSHEDGWVGSYPAAGGIKAAVAEIERLAGVPEEDGGYGPGDLVVWHEGRVRAVVRVGADGEATSKIFPTD